METNNDTSNTTYEIDFMIGGVTCDSDQEPEECLKNSPEFSIDGFAVMGVMTYVFLGIVLSILVITMFVIWKYKRNR